jgi:hypothetical protein
MVTAAMWVRLRVMVGSWVLGEVGLLPVCGALSISVM